MQRVTRYSGTEFHGDAQWQERFGIGVCFAAPYHSWARGTNEKTNGLIGQSRPKGTCFKELAQRQCDVIESTE